MFAKRKSKKFPFPKYHEEDYRAYNDNISDGFQSDDFLSAGINDYDNDLWSGDKWKNLPENIKKKLRTFYRKEFSQNLPDQNPPYYVKPNFHKNMVDLFPDDDKKQEDKRYHIHDNDTVYRKP